MIVRYAPKAIEQLESIADYLAPRSPLGAKAVSAAIHRAVDAIGLFPHSGRPAASSGLRIKPVVGRPYIIIYEVDEPRGEIVILGVFHTAQARDENMT